MGLIAYSTTLGVYVTNYKHQHHLRGLKRDMPAAGLALARSILGCANEAYLISYGFYYTNTTIGAFAFQQFFYYPVIIGLFTGLAYHIQLGTRDLCPAPSMLPCPPLFKQSWTLLPLTLRAGCDLVLWIVFWYLLLRSKGFRDRKLNCLIIDVHELATGTRPSRSRIITWTGKPRRRGMTLQQARTLRSIRKFPGNLLFRRVSPVETRMQVLVQHVFALASIALIIVRAVSVIRNASEDLPSRKVVKLCEQFSPPTQLYMRIKHYPGMFADDMYERLIDQLTINVSSYHLCRGIHDSERVEFVSLPCNVSLPEGKIDEYRTYTCQMGGSCKIQNYDLPAYAGTFAYGYEIELPPAMITPNHQPNGGHSVYDWLTDHAISFWLGLEPWNTTETRRITHLTPPIQPAFGWLTVSKAYFALRRFIVSSPLSDAITGSDPRYTEELYFPSSLLRREPVPVNLTDGASSNVMRATGLIYTPHYLEASEQIPYSHFKSDLESQDTWCEVTEEYRSTSTFDTFASIGGLLALLQGLHILLFGRPLFWGLLGAKLIAPFGLMGNLATQGFKKRLQERYHHPSQSRDEEGRDDGPGPQSATDVDISQFLLDYVIDMGPASAPSHEGIDVESSDSEDEVDPKPVPSLPNVEITMEELPRPEASLPKTLAHSGRLNYKTFPR